MRGPICYRAGLVMAATLVTLWTGTPAGAATQDSFEPVGSMAQDRDGAQVVLLMDGRVLVTGGNHCVGNDCTVLSSAELFDPKTNQFTPIGAMSTPRDDSHRAVLLKDGRVLITGGSPDYQMHLSSAEIFDPATGVFTAAGKMLQGLAAQTATLLSDGRVLIAGGYGTSGPQTAAELFDPVSGTFQKTGSMATGRYRHAAVALADGRVAILGGFDPRNTTLASVEIYDPQMGAFHKPGNLVQARGDMTADLLPDGRILVTGGMDTGSDRNQWIAVQSVEIYDPASGQSTITGSMSDPRGFQVSSLLPGGRVLVAGGWTGTDPLRSADIIDAATGKPSPTAPMTVPRSSLSGVGLLDGRVLVLGGDAADGSSLATAEVFVPAGLVSQTPP